MKIPKQTYPYAWRVMATVETDAGPRRRQIGRRFQVKQSAYDCQALAIKQGLNDAEVVACQHRDGLQIK